MPNQNIKNLVILKEVIGECLFQELIEEMPGSCIRLPNCADHFNKSQRNRQLIHDFHAGLEVGDLVKKYSLSKSRIYKILEKIQEHHI